MQREFWTEGFRVFGIYGKTANGGCECGNDECKAVLKHPISAGWQNTPLWSDEQLDTMHMMGQFKTGFGVLCRGLLVIDVDARNGGMDGFEKLRADVPEIDSAGLVVFTGSGGGSRHLYFKVDENAALVSHLKDYPGIDFKSSGYVIGPGSLHNSGARYEVDVGSPDGITVAPKQLLDILKQPDLYRADISGVPVDVSHADIADMLRHVDPDCDHETWVKSGMSAHHASGGTAFNVWDEWSAKGSKYPGGDVLSKRWHSFGKSSNPVTLGTLAHYASEGGWISPVDFVSDQVFADPVTDDGLPYPLDGVDILRPPGFVGKVAEYFASKPRRRRDKLAVAAALVSMGNIVGLRHIDKRDGVTANLFCFCVAGSGSGKEAIQSAFGEIHRVAGIAGALHGAIKSEQELVRNLTRHQASFYSVDEISDFLEKIQNAKKKGTASYLEGVIATLMSAYSKASGYMPLTGDMKEDMRDKVSKDIARLNKRMDDGDQGLEDQLNDAMTVLSDIDNGLKNPFVSLIGFGTPDKFDNLIDFRSATEGFIGRSLIFNELNSAPEMKENYTKTEMPLDMELEVMNLWGGGESESGQRVKYDGKRIEVPTDAEADEMLKVLSRWMDKHAKLQTEVTGLEALYLRGYEMVSKVSFILGAPSGLRTAEHVRWATALVLKDLEDKTNLVVSNDRVKDAPQMALRARLMGLLERDEWTSVGMLRNKCRRYKPDDVNKTLDNMVSMGVIVKKVDKHKTTKKEVLRFKRKE